LKAGLVVDGGISEAGDKLKVTVRLVEGASGGTIDHATFTYAKSEVLSARENLVRDVAAILRRRLGQEITLAERRTGTTSDAAWILVQRADRLRREAASAADDSITERLFNEADSLLADAETRDPAYGAPIAMRAAIALKRVQWAPTPAAATPWIPVALGHAERALALNPRDADALEVRGTLNLLRVQRNLAANPAESADLLESAEADLTEAVTINPRQATALNALSQLSYRKLDLFNAHINARRALEEDAYLAAAPDIIWRLFATSYDLERTEDAQRWCREGLRRFPTPRFRQCSLYLMTMPDAQPDIAQAWEIADTVTAASPEGRRPLQRREMEIVVATALARAAKGERDPGRRALLADSARHVLARASAARGGGDGKGELLGMEAVARTILGDRAEALKLLKMAITENPEHRAGLRRNTWWFKDLENEPSFNALVEVGR
jgi:tetratricopeptide (TPR) repeat protein